ncbi:hypothetical protein CONCODRAFT_3879 [Conidiobolus coronatus NRRL 28638]|uniref:Uncharacterized protein n=1 Tax=Conidiobolus coronatus (strain ATCC 28846 / CBS 209.66 / NRRL 28638) TaxID=796925 RepID=A0A137PDX7_CONC2|nr:hypothetical protein CONCODRAFT_3879 [Conidiobolus coronatus NRRL 28638]|eukprot:KXN73208.1 hypothetical protein CONCODRAFT_3879 [Conidiobolus coronatus NRRL 28638]
MVTSLKQTTIKGKMIQTHYHKREFPFIVTLTPGYLITPKRLIPAILILLIIREFWDLCLWNPWRCSTVDQAVGRVIRSGSHDMLKLKIFANITTFLILTEFVQHANPFLCYMYELECIPIFTSKYGLDFVGGVHIKDAYSKPDDSITPLPTYHVSHPNFRS